ncbi:hypothetical protein [Aestuariibacter salexigens]|uniref:hypothetical protein n=1 Tax=Aestuariibacter salexigens TaxID=226010 RepID=UPI000424CC2F|nr:hypothetical protein [Aestuariibacter salexigens]
MPELDNETLLSLWMDGNLDDSQRQLFERRLAEDESFSKMVETVNQVHMHAEQFTPLDVPKWDKESTFQSKPKRRWWQWQGIPAASMAMSVCAMLMVVSGTQFRYQDGVFSMSFGHQVQQQEVELLANQIVEQRLDKFTQQQEVAFTTYAAALQQQQQTSNAELTAYLLASSRQERREDFAELISFINQQRSDDQLFYARQINQLQQEIYTEPGALSPASVQQ